MIPYSVRLLCEMKNSFAHSLFAASISQTEISSQRDMMLAIFGTLPT
jgi:hypothetical protein